MSAKLLSRNYTPSIATAIIVANMIGTGVFTSLGFQLADITSGFAIMMLWIFGGIAALCGAACYAELGASLPRSGGEYNFLGRIYHPAAGFVSGVVSATVGFAAPIAAVAIAFGYYIVEIIPALESFGVKSIALALLVIITIVHSFNRRQSGQFQLSFTALKIVLILAFSLAALILVPDPQTVQFTPRVEDLPTLGSASFGIALIYVSYSYTGWNAAVYVSGELDNPQRDLPKVLISGTALVMAIYVLLNFVFLKVAPIEDMVGRVEIGYIAAQAAFGDIGGRVAGTMLALLLVSTVSAMTIAGPRALQAMGEDFSSLRILSRVNKDEIPTLAIMLQSSIAALFILTSSFKTIIIFAGAMIAFNSFLAVLGLFIIRFRYPDSPRPYTTWGFPITPVIYLAITGFTLVYVILDNPVTALFGLGFIGLSLIFYLITSHLSK